MKIHLLLLSSAVALAATLPLRADDAAAAKSLASRSQIIAKGEVAAVTSDYAPDAILHWIGGPLNGEYRGVESIRSVWTKFTGAQAPLTVKLSGEKESVAGSKRTLSGNAEFTGAKGNMIPVEYSLTTEAGKITEETWRIAAKPVAK